MKNFFKFYVILSSLLIVGAFFVVQNIEAATATYQTTTLEIGWNIVSTPRILLSHEFSAPEISDNFDIYLLDPTAISGWKTMQEAGQTEFQPLFAYFVNNKTGQTQTLKLNYNFDLTPAQRLFQRTLQPGWNAIGISSPSYAKTKGSNNIDTNNPSNILSSINSSIGQVVDFTNGNIDLDSPKVTNSWLSKTASDANSLNDFRELKGYGIFITSATNNYIGSQDLVVPDKNAPVITRSGSATVSVSFGGPYNDAGATALDDVDGDITANIVTVNPVNVNVAGTYIVTYNVLDSSGNAAPQATRTVTVQGIPGTLTITKDSTSPVADLVLGNTTVTLGVFRLAATGAESLDVDDITLTVVGGTYAGTFYFYNGTTLLGSAAGSIAPKLVLSDGTLTVPANGYVRVTVKVALSPVDDVIVTNGATIATSITIEDAVNATGLSSGEEVDSNTQTAAANTMTIVKAKPTVTLASGSPSGTLFPSTAESLAIFSVTGQGADDVTFSSGRTNLFTVQVSRNQGTSDGVAGNWVLKDEAGSTLSTISVGDFDTEATFTFATSEFRVGPGETKKLYIYGDTHEYTTQYDSIQLYLSDASDAQCSYSVNAGTTIAAGTKIFRGNIYAGTFTRP
ncbi:MAG: immunoglobulin-like domain-containing protein [Candidatus Staskawiczbacteria bacterium]|jgi:hypothetical protein